MTNTIKISELLSDLEQNCPKIVHFSAIHMLEKEFNIENDILTQDQKQDFFMNYTKYTRYLNDYAGVIYNQFESSIDNIYNTLCEYYDLNPDNKYLYEYRLAKLKKSNPARLLTIADDEMKELALKRVEEKLEEIYQSKYYKTNKNISKEDLAEIEKNIILLKKVLKIS